MLGKFIKLTLALVAGLLILLTAVVMLPDLYDRAYGLYHHKEISNVKDRYVRFHSSLHEKKFEDALQCMTPDYRQGHTIEEFQAQFAALGDDWLALAPRCYIRITGNRAVLYPANTHWLDLWTGPLYDLEKIDGVWAFTGDYVWFYD